MALALLLGSVLIDRSESMEIYTWMYTNALVSWVLSIHNPKSLTGYKFGTELLENWIQVPTVQLTQWMTLEMSLFFNLPIWKMLGLDQRHSFQRWVCFIIYESCLLLHPISIVLKAHFSSFSPVRMIASFPFSNLITYFYIFVIMVSFHHFSTWMNSIRYLWLQKLQLHFSLFSFMATFWILFPNIHVGLWLRAKSLDLSCLYLKPLAEGEILGWSLNMMKFKYSYL